MENGMEKRTDLAIEAHELYTQTENNNRVPGVKIDIEQMGEITISRVRVLNKDGEKAINKPAGNYITVEIPELIHRTQHLYEKTIEAVTGELSKLLKIKHGDLVLVVGLGNRNITADALGPMVVSQLLVTRHLFELMPEELEDGIRPVCALSPGVLGVTGIETGEILKGVAQRVKPNLLIVIDALASRRLERVSTTIQLSDTGLSPGSGIGNTRMAINEESLGIPVIAIGVPTVVDAATMANDTIDLVIDRLLSQAGENSEFYSVLKNLDREENIRLSTRF